MEGAAGEHRRELLAAARAHRVAAGEDERDVAAQAGGQLGELVTVEAEAPELVARDEGGRRVGRAAGHAAGDRNVLVDADREALVDDPRSATRRAARTARLSPSVGMRSAYVPAGMTCQSSQRATETSSCSDDRLVDRRERVEAVGPARPDAQVEVDLGRDPHGHRAGLGRSDSHAPTLGADRLASGRMAPTACAGLRRGAGARDGPRRSGRRS